MTELAREGPETHEERRGRVPDANRKPEAAAFRGRANVLDLRKENRRRGLGPLRPAPSFLPSRGRRVVSHRRERVSTATRCGGERDRSPVTVIVTGC